ncbi:MAG: 6,7-dimethyl-8-ribityllumazine synthase [bacterium JZ-2024 1]
MKEIQGTIRGESIRVSIVVSRFNSQVTQRLLDGCVDMLQRLGVRPDDITIYWTPGSLEIPPLIQQLLKRNLTGDGIIALGAVIRGQTPHFDVVAQQVSRNMGQLSLQSPVPIMFGILTTDTLEQALERAGGKMGNRGADVAVALLEMIALYKQLSSQ